jgi:hypothetical protein
MIPIFPVHSVSSYPVLCRSTLNERKTRTAPYHLSLRKSQCSFHFTFHIFRHLSLVAVGHPNMSTNSTSSLSSVATSHSPASSPASSRSSGGSIIPLYMMRRHIVFGDALRPVETVLEVLINPSDQASAHASFQTSHRSSLGDLSDRSTASSVAGPGLEDSGYGSNSHGEEGGR